MSISFFAFRSLPFRLSVTKLVSFNLSVYLFIGTLVETKIPTEYYNGYLVAARNQTRPQGINNTGKANVSSRIGQSAIYNQNLNVNTQILQGSLQALLSLPRPQAIRKKISEYR